MDLEALRIFIKVAELGSFTRASEQLAVPKSKVSLSVKSLEADVGSRLLQRTTRAVRMTPDGEQFLARARRLLLEADELGAMFQLAGAMRGRVRIDLPVIFAREVLIPKLPEFLAAHREIELIISTTDRRVDVVREGFDCVLRIGTLIEPGLTAKRLGSLPMINCASPGYLAKYGTPRTLAELEWHFIVHYSQSLGSEPPSFEHHDGTRYRELPMKSRITVNSADAFHAACLAGLGIIQVPRAGLRAVLAAGLFVDILPEHPCEPMPVSLVHSHGRNVPKRVRAVMSWLEETMLRELG
jgi:DNA-binding transcriptional LysR family regulator